MRANSLRLEQGALWFDALGLRRALPLLEHLPGLSSFTARREAATQIFDSLNAEGRFETAALTYRGMTLRDFQGSFGVADRTIRMTSARFRTDGGRGEGEGIADFTTSPPGLSAKASLVAISLQSWTARLPGPGRGLRGTVNVSGRLQTRGLAREELAENLVGQLVLRVKDVSFGEFDPLGRLVEQAHWGKLEPSRSPVTLSPATLNVEIRDRRFILKTTTLDLSGSRLQCKGTYAWTGAVDLNVVADPWRFRRRWLARDELFRPTGLPLEVRLGGPIEHLAVNPPQGLATVARSRGVAGH